MKDLENYKVRETEIVDSKGRFIRIYDPKNAYPNDSFIKLEQEGVVAIGKIIRQAGQHRVDLDILSSRLKKGTISAKPTAQRFEIPVRDITYSKLAWVETSEGTEHTMFQEGRVLTKLEPIDRLVPLLRHGSHLVFYPESLAPSFEKLMNAIVPHFSNATAFTAFPQGFFAQDATFSARFIDDSDALENGIECFVPFTKHADLAVLHLRYQPELSQFLTLFETQRNPSTTVMVFVSTDRDVYPIVESLNFGSGKAVWVIDENGKIDPMRTRSFVLEGDQDRALILKEIHDYNEQKFEANLLGEPFEEREIHPFLQERIL